MKNTLRITILFLIVVSGSGILLAQQLMHYTSEKFAYSIQVPEDWKRKENVRGDKISLVLISPEGATMSVVFHDPGKLTKEQFIKQYIESAYKGKKDFSLEEKGVFKSRDDEAQYIVADYKDEEKERCKVCFYQRGAEITVVTMTHKKSKFNAELEKFDLILKSFTFETDQNKVDSEE
jgi:hypothetical protein